MGILNALAQIALYRISNLDRRNEEIAGSPAFQMGSATASPHAVNANNAATKCLGLITSIASLLTFAHQRRNRSAVDGNSLAGYEPGIIGGEESRDPGNILGLAPPPGQILRLPCLA